MAAASAAVGVRDAAARIVCRVPQRAGEGLRHDDVRAKGPADPFVGIGGIGMSGIAEVLLNLGYHVSGSDLAATPVTERLQVLGGAHPPRTTRRTSATHRSS